MMNKVSAITIAVLLGCTLPRAAAAAEYQLYTPRTLEGEATLPEKGKGILVKRITIKRGDTLGGLSRHFSGRTSYFPQILLFNNIRNPDLIYAGKELYVPVTLLENPDKADTAAPPARKPAAPAKAAVAKPAKPAAAKVRPAASSPAEAAADRQAPGEKSGAKNEQNAYLQALNEYRKGDYNGALASFSKFLEKYPESSLAPDASLYKAECLFKLSGE